MPIIRGRGSMGQQLMRRYRKWRTTREDRDDLAAMANELSEDIVAIIFGCLSLKDIMRMRGVCKKWRDAAKKTFVPMADFSVNNVVNYNAMRVMTITQPNLQQLSISNLGSGHKYIEGEDPDEQWARYNLKWYLDILASFPLLKELKIIGMISWLTGNLRSLRVLKDILEVVEISCHCIEGNFMDLAAFPRLKKLDLRHTSVTGDVRDIGENVFTTLESLDLPRTVCGGVGYDFQSIAEVPSFMQAIYLLLQRTPTLFKKETLRRGFFWRLAGRISEASPDWYDRESSCPFPPFRLQIIQAGSRRGWSWCTHDDHSCEINWLDPEPSRESSGYKAYVEELQGIERNVGFYRGYSQPPTLAEYNRLCLEYRR